jgi:DNA polymerase I-like protein with 3'-5' exonuclease and polymerase domains
MIEVVADIETDGFDATKLHVFSANYLGNIFSTPDKLKVEKLCTRDDIILIGHNFYRFDIPTLERLFKFKTKAKVVDTLALSWYLYPERARHGLADWGEEFGVPKPEIDDWVGLSYEEYKYRCEEDVKINTLLWEKIRAHLLELYGSEEEMWKLIDYLMFKMDCAAEQERSQWRFDKKLAEETFNNLSQELEKAQDELRMVMPKVPIKKKKKRPVKPYKKNGELSAIGEKWFDLLKEQGKPDDVQEVEYIDGYLEPNPGSTTQIKDWLFSLGWTPCTHKFVRNKETGDTRQIPQIRTKNGNNEAILTPSVEVLLDKVPELKALQHVGIIKHRYDVVSGFLRNEREGFLQARIKGLTNTLRFKHEEIVNLPGVDKPYGKQLRACLIARDGYELCGSDMSSLEDRTKQHYMFPFDPQYVKEMMTPDFDPHIDLAVQGGLMSEEEGVKFKNATSDFKTTALYKSLSGIRKKGKATNYACVYGAGGATVARAAGIPKREGDELVEVYWKRNWSVKAVADSQKVKTVRGQKWLFNPVSKFWYSLRHDKDRFSTLNQGTGVYCFDTWIKFVRSKRPQLSGQMHDEIIIEVKKGNRDKAQDLLKWAIKETNKLLKLNRELDVDIQFGNSYADIH